MVDSPQLVPRVPLARDKALPLIIAGSLLLHVLVLLPLLRRDTVEPQPVEIPVELVQLPDKASEKPAEKPPATPAKAPEKPAASPQAKAAPPPPKTAPKTPAPKTPAPKTATKAPAAKAPAAKPPSPKPPERPQRRAAKAPMSQPEPRFVPPAAQPPRPNMSVAERFKAMVGPMPVVALPGASADGSDAVAYSQLVLSQLAKAKKQGRYRGTPGRASVAFSIGDKGELVRLDLVGPSGDATLDAEAVAMIKRAAPYPPPPPGGQRDYAITLRFAAI